MNQWELIRLRCVRDGEPVSVLARPLGLSRNTSAKVRAPHRPAPARVATYLTLFRSRSTRRAVRPRFRVSSCRARLRSPVVELPFTMPA